jgi:hypothetical protein
VPATCERSSSLRSGARLRRAACTLSVLVLAGGPLACRPGPSLDVKVWPLLRYARNDARGELRWSVLGPLIEYVRTPELRDLRIRPLLWLTRRLGDTPQDRMEILTPIVSAERQPGYRSLRFLLVSRSWTAPRDASESDTSSFTFFPFVFYRHDRTHGTTGGVFPFYLDLADVFGYERMRTVLFPAYLALDEPRVERRFYGFPFVSAVGGRDGRGWRVWPFYGDTAVAGRERERFVLWPFYVESERLAPEYGWERRLLVLPAYGALDGEQRTSRGYGVFAYTHTVDERIGSEAIGNPWPLIFRERRLGEESWRVWRLAPIYGRSDRDGIRSSFWLWPLYRTTDQDDEDFHFHRRDGLLVIWRHQWERDEDTRHSRDLDTVLGLLRSDAHDGRPAGQIPALMDSLVPANRGVLAMWAPLWALVRWDTSAAGRLDWNLLWGLAARERGRLRPPFFIDTAPPVEAPRGG